MIHMIKQIAWNVFKNTGDINTYLEFSQVKNIEENLKVKDYENGKGKWDSNSRKEYGRL